MENIIIKPLITEKATRAAEKFQQFGFIVKPEANKIEVKTAIEKMYGVNIQAINTIVVYGKTKSRNTKAGVVTGNAPKYKKAIVTLKDGETIDFYSNI